MRGLIRVVLLLALLGSSSLAAAPAGAQATPIPGPCQSGVLPSGALWLICVPTAGWNGDLVIYAHGYTAPGQPLGFQNLTLPDGTSIPALVQSLGFAFATTSFRRNGLAILEGVDDVRELVQQFPSVARRAPAHTYLTGVSEGGLVTTLAVERWPRLFSGGLAACGPIGDFRRQINYLGDFRVLFDYFFPGVIPPSPISIPGEVIAGWETTYVPLISGKLAADPGQAMELIRTSKAAVDPGNPATVVTTTLNMLWYNVFATNDAKERLGGNPYGNRFRWYWGSSNDLALNLGVQRFSADPTALQHLAAYQTSGDVRIPLVTLHTTGDEVVPFWHEVLYLGKVRTSGRGSVTPIPIVRYGHCNFTTSEVLGAFGLLVAQVTGAAPAGLSQRLDAEQAQRDFTRARQDFLEAERARPQVPARPGPGR